MDEQERYEQGLSRLMEMDPERTESLFSELDEIAPGLSRYIAGFAFGEIYGREGLDLRERQLVTIGALTARGDAERQLGFHLSAALSIGLAPREIVEAIVQCLPYTGFPRVVNAVMVAKQVFAERGVRVEEP